MIKKQKKHEEEQGVEENLDWKRNLLRIMNILQDNGVDISALPTKGTDEKGNRYYISLKDIKQDGIDIEAIIHENQLERDYKMGQKLARFRSIYRGTAKGKMSAEERSLAEELGVVEKVSENRKKPLANARKISQFHIDIVQANLEAILTGKLNTNEVIALINGEAIKAGETQIKDKETIKRLVARALEGKPEELKRYKESLAKIGRREEDTEYVNALINDYLPRFINGEITLEMIAEELNTAYETFDRIIKAHYTNSGDTEGLNSYEMMKKKSRGSSIEKRDKAKRWRSEVAEYDVVSDAEFLLLSEEEQDRQVVLKIQKDYLKQEKRGNQKTKLMKEEAISIVVKKLKDYFRGKNDYGKGVENFSEQDIRYMIFRYPTIISRSAQTLDEKFNVLTSYDEIDEQTAYGMVKTFPSILGYEAKRTKAQLDLLQSENLIDAPISKPVRMMQSVKLMYALIQYAKERHHTSDLSDVSRSNIFMANSNLKRLYGCSYDDLKKRFPYDDVRDEEDTIYTVGGQEIGEATYQEVSVTQADEASKIVSEIIKSKEKREVK